VCTFNNLSMEEPKLAKVELNKSIEARKLNQRSGLPMTGPEVTIPYVAIIEHVETDRDREKFHYLGNCIRAATKSSWPR